MKLDPSDLGEKTDLAALYRAIYRARLVDRQEQALIDQGVGHFHVAGTGHEMTAALAMAMEPQDWLFPHYRDKALMMAAGLPLKEVFAAFLASPASQSAGRQMSAHYSWRDRNIASLVGPVGNNALQAVGAALALKDTADRPVVICAMGDGTTQQGEVLEAFAEAARQAAPVLFLVEDNGWAISTVTRGRTVFDMNGTAIDHLFGLPVVRFCGWDVDGAIAACADAMARVRSGSGPLILLGRFERLSDHTNADDQQVYRPDSDFKEFAGRDPVENLRAALARTGLTEARLQVMEQAVQGEVEAALAAARAENAPATHPPVRAPFPPALATRPDAASEKGDLTMREALNRALKAQLASDPAVVLLGEDIEDPKGDVFGVTRGLSSAFPGRVLNSALSESTIVGTSIGRALAGEKPIAFIQFADFLPLAANQIISELSTIYWRTAGHWSAPVVIMAPVGGYKPGLGPFHGQSMESIFAQCPGLDVVMPSSAADAAGLLNAALAGGRPTLFLYPKAMLNLPDKAMAGDGADAFTLPGRAKRLRTGADLTIVAWGNTVPLAEAAAERLAEDGIGTDLIDLRSISPWDREMVSASTRRTGRLLVVHEENLTGGFGAEIAAHAAETARSGLRVARVGRQDTYIPFNFADQLAILPSVPKVLEAAAGLLDLQIDWEPDTSALTDADAVLAIGSGPADDLVKVVELHVQPGDQIEEGQLVAVVEATKAAVDVCAQRAGIVADICARVGDDIRVGAAVITLEPAEGGAAPERDIPLKAVFTGRAPRIVSEKAAADHVALGAIRAVNGSRLVTTEELAARWPGRKTEDILRATGIRERHWAGPGQTLLGMATEAAKAALAAEGMAMADIGLVVAATGTPDVITPSLASRVTVAAAGDGPVPQIAAYDVNAACSGYIYAMEQAWQFLATRPEASVLVITAEILSPALDLDDPDTAVIFADAATATVVHGAGRGDSGAWRVSRPVLGGHPEPGRLISVPLGGRGYVRMLGRQVFADAVRSMTEIVNRACDASGLTLADLDALVPHQANQRIIDAVERRAGVRAFSVIEHFGNTSSSSIPLALAQPGLIGDRVALCAFGGGYTTAAAIMDR